MRTTARACDPYEQTFRQPRKRDDLARPVSDNLKPQHVDRRLPDSTLQAKRRSSEKVVDLLAFRALLDGCKSGPNLPVE